MKNFYSIAVFTSPKYNHIVNDNLKDQDYLVTQTHFIESDLSWDAFVQSFLHHYFNVYFYHKLKIVNVITKGSQFLLWGNLIIDDEINPYSFKLETEILNDEKIYHEFRDNEQDSLHITHVYDQTFFTKDYILKFLKDNLNEDKFTIYIFHNMDWKFIVQKFRVCNFIVSGGNNTNRHIFSPIKYILSYFLICLYGRKKILGAISYSLHKISKDKTHAKINGKLDKKTRDYINNETSKIEGFLHKKSSITPTFNQKREYSTIKDNTLIKENDDLLMKYFYQSKNEYLKSFIKDILKNPFYFNLRKKFENKNLDLTQIQLYIEDELMSTWRHEVKKLFKNPQKFLNSEYGVGIIHKVLIKLDEELNILKCGDKRTINKKKYKNYFLLMDNHDIITIIICLAIPFCLKYGNFEDHNIINLYNIVGNELVKTFLTNEWLKYNNKNSETYLLNISKPEILTIKVDNEQNYISFKKGLTENEFKNELIKQLGTLNDDDFLIYALDLLYFVAEKTKLFEIKIIFIDKKMEKRIVIPGEKLDQNIANIIRIDKSLLPMVCEPSKWVFSKNDKNEFETVNYGGFLLNNINKIDLIRKSNKSFGKTRLNNLYIVDSVNYLSSIKFEINKNVLEFILNLLDNDDKYIKELIKINKEKVDLKKCIGKNKILLEALQHNSQYYNDSCVLQLALLLCNNVIYFPLFIEWRGRLYTESGFLSYQKSELAKALIYFNEGEILTKNGLDSLKIYTANCFGKNKLSYNKRLEWVDENLVKIIDLNKTFIFEADEPLLFLACCFELKGYYENPKTFISKLPILTDATCNGLQHLSAMVQDTHLGKYVNICKSSKEDVPNDVYQYMVHKLNELVKETVDKSPNLIKFSFIKFCRSFIKRAIMTIPYGSTARGIAKQLRSDHFILGEIVNKKQTYVLNDKKFFNTDIDFYLTYSEIYILAKIIHGILYNTFPSLNLFVQYLKEMNKILKKLSLTTIWISPSGLIIEQKYLQMKKKEHSSTFLGRRRTLTVKRPVIDKISLRKQNQSIVPNLVHSFDASNIAILVKQLLKDTNYIKLFTIHDCFATTANHVEVLKFQVRFAFMLLYSNKHFINTYHDFILKYIKYSGYKLNCDNTEVILNKRKFVKIPNKPLFDENKDFIYNVLGSEYFTN